MRSAQGAGQSGDRWPSRLQLKQVSFVWSGLRAGVVKRRTVRTVGFEEEEEGEVEVRS